MIHNPVIAQGGASFPRDPMEVYKTTRPKDWLPMPAPADNEIYLLFHIPDGASSLVAFNVTCTGSYTVALGAVSGGTFAERSRTSLASGDVYQNELSAADWGDLTSDGFRQVMIKVSGTDLLTWRLSPHSNKTLPASFAAWNIVEIACRMPRGTAFPCGNSTAVYSLRSLRYFAWYGPNELTAAAAMFTYCQSLTAVLALDTSKVDNLGSMFHNCYSLRAIPLLDTSTATSFSQMFRSCVSLEAIPDLDSSNVTNMSAMFYGCQSLITVPALDFSKVTNLNSTFYNCYSLRAVPEMDTSSTTTFKSMFYNNHALSRVPALNTASITNMTDMFRMAYAVSAFTLDPAAAGWAGADLSLSNCSLGHAALVELLNSLPTITEAHKLTLTGIPGVSELTDAEKAVAAGKNWTLTL